MMLCQKSLLNFMCALFYYGVAMRFAREVYLIQFGVEKNGTIIYHDTFVYFIEMFLKLGTTSFYYSMLFILNILLNKYFNVLFVVVLFYVECEGLLLDEGKNFIALESNTITDGMSYSLTHLVTYVCVCHN